MMRRDLRSFVLAVSQGVLCVFLVGGCSKYKLRMPIEEINRPLSLPPGNWRLGVSAGPLYEAGGRDHYRPFASPLNDWRFGLDGGPLFYHDRIAEKTLDINPILSYPYFQIGKKWEYYIPGTFKWYVLKNVKTENDLISITGANLATTLGLTGIAYSQSTKLNLSLRWFIDYKQPITPKLWIISNLLIDFITYESSYDGTLGAGLGYQISKRLYTVIEPTISQSNYGVYYSISPSLLNEKQRYTTRFSRESNYYGTIPILIGANLSDRWSMFWKTNVRLNSDGELQLGSVVGLYVIW